MAILSTSNLLSSQRYDISDARRIESAVRNDFDTTVTSIITGTSQGYIIRGFSIATSGAIGSAANGLQLIVDPGAVLNIDASVSGTIFQTPIGTPNQILNAAVNTNVSGSFSANSTNYVGIDYNRFADPTTDVTKYIWNPSANDEIPEIAPAAQTLTFEIFITTSVWAENVLPIAIVTTDPNGNVTSITDARWMLYSLGTGGLAPNPNFVYPWTQGQTQSPITVTNANSSANPFNGGDKQLGDLKDWMNAIMSQIQAITGTPYWFSPVTPSIIDILQDLGNTVITGAGEISNGILPNSTALLVATGIITGSSPFATNLSSVAGLSNGDFVFGTGIPTGTTIQSIGAYSFTVTSANATAGDTYSNNGQTFTVVSSISAATTLVCTGTGAPTASGTLTKVSGTGDATITFSAFTSINTVITLSKTATLNGSGIGITFYSPAVITTPGQINWDEPIYIRVIGSSLTYVLAANPSSTDISLADDEVAYIVLNRNEAITPQLIFNAGSPTVVSVGNVAWTSGLLVGDYIKVASDLVSGYYQIQTINSTSSVTLTTNVASGDNYPLGITAQFAYGSYSAAPTPSTPRNIFISSRETVPADAFWLFLREDNGGAPRVYIRFLAQELDNGESVEVSGTTSLELLQYIGSKSAADSSPQYVAALNPGSVPQITDFVIGAASTITSGEYFLINSSANARQYAVWFKINGVGSEPVVPNVQGYIEVDILSTDTAAEVATKIQNALNTSLFGDFTAVAGNEYLFTITPANATTGAVYSNNTQTFTVVNNISSSGASLINSASNFALLASSAITNTGSSVITGDVGITPGSSITPGAWTLIGTEHVDDATATTAKTDAGNGYTTMAAHAGYVAIPANLNGQTLTAGYYSEASGTFNLAASGPGTLTLSGSATDIFVFKAASTLTTGAGGVPTISLVGGALASNVYWLVGSSATINSGSAGTFQGNIIAQASITNTLGGTVNGSLIALTGAITISAAANVTAIPGSSATSLIATGTGNPTASGTLTKVSGTGDATITFSSFTEVSNVVVTNTSAGTTNASSAGSVGTPFAVYTVQSGTGTGNYIIHDGDNLTLAIKELDQALGSLEASLDSPTYDEVVEIVASGATPPTSLNGPIANNTVITMPLNSRENNSLAQYTAGKGTLQVFLNGQFIDVESGAYEEVGAPGTPSNQIEILTFPDGLVVGDELEFRVGTGGGGGGGLIGPPGVPGPAGAPGLNGSATPIAISTKTSSYGILSTDGFLMADCTGGAIVFTLPLASTVTGRIFYATKIDSSVNTLTVAGNGSDLINELSTFIMAYQDQEAGFISTGSGWRVC